MADEDVVGKWRDKKINNVFDIERVEDGIAIGTVSWPDGEPEAATIPVTALKHRFEKAEGE